MGEDIKKALQKQLQLLSERSQAPNVSDEILVQITEVMVKLVSLINDLCFPL